MVWMLLRMSGPDQAFVHNQFTTDIIVIKKRSNRYLHVWLFIPARSAMELERRPHRHFLVATFPFQGHINPALYLAKHLARSAGPGTVVTFSTTVSAHRRIFPAASLSSHDHGSDEAFDGLLHHAPFSDGLEKGDGDDWPPLNDYMAEFFNVAGPRSFSGLVADLAARGRPVTCIVYTMLVPWAAAVAREHGIPAVHYWIQPATVFAIYYHCFHEYGAIFDAHREDPSFAVAFPGLPPIKIRDVPSFVTTAEDHPLYFVHLALKEAFAALDMEKEPAAAANANPKVLVNTFDELEPGAIASVDAIDMVTIGPLIPSWPSATDSGAGGDIFAPDEESYWEWLDSKPEKSVVYVSFGSLYFITKRELEEITAGLEATGRPYLLVVRRNNRETAGLEPTKATSCCQGMVVEWCSQVKVLSHPAVGCFVTHCGWNSMLESLACGVPTVGVPRLSDQATNASMAESMWGTGVKVAFGGDGLMDGGELRRCVEAVMGEGERGEGMRRKAAEWKEKASAAVGEGGSSDRNLRIFLKEIETGSCLKI